jgi:mono/diheme cytochrome c family protein
VKEWELDAVIAYLWTLQLKAEDLDLSESDWTKLKDGKTDAATAKWLQQQYFQASPATFIDAYNSIVASDKLEGNPERGRNIYEMSCLHCHAPQTHVTQFTLDDSKMTFRYLRNNFGKYNHASLFQLARFGTHPMMGYRPYMPNYTLERMSHQQMADLKAYIEVRSNDNQ